MFVSLFSELRDDWYRPNGLSAAQFVSNVLARLPRRIDAIVMGERAKVVPIRG
jgi:hypothetical protein